MADGTIAGNQFLPLTAGVTMSDGTQEPLQQADPNATVAWTEDGNGAVIKLSAVAGFDIEADAVGPDGVATVTCTETLQDGRVFVPVFVVQVLAGVVTIVSGVIIPGEPTLQ